MFFNLVSFVWEGCTCVSLFYDNCRFFGGPRRSHSCRWSSQVWFFKLTRAMCLQTFILRTHTPTTDRLCVSILLCPTVFCLWKPVYLLILEFFRPFLGVFSLKFPNQKNFFGSYCFYNLSILSTRIPESFTLLNPNLVISAEIVSSHPKTTFHGHNFLRNSYYIKSLISTYPILDLKCIHE